jgi:hypothetical protein
MGRGYGRYGAKRTEYNGITFDSALEAKYYQEQIEPRLKDGTITDLILQPSFELIPSFTKNGKKYSSLTYIADFQFYDEKDCVIRIIDIKGDSNEVFDNKKKLFEFRYANFNLEVVSHANYCGWVDYDEHKKIIRARKRYKEYLKEAKNGPLSPQKKKSMEKLEAEYNKYIEPLKK